MLPIAKAEFIQMLRDPLVLFMATVIPLGISVFLYWNRDTIGGTPVIASLVMAVIPSFVVYASTTTTLASRRQNLFLKRMRSTSLSDPAILLGLSLVLIVLSAAQTLVILMVLTLVDSGPSSPVHVVAVLLLTHAMFFGLALATAGITSSPDSAQITVLPITMGVVGVATWVAATGTDEMAGLKLSLPGGAAAELIVQAWSEGATGEMTMLLIPTLVWVGLAFLAARFLFQWEPRR
ncbi:ABC transporter permease [Auritidibacter ignavus]|uniref:ABC transporter permease n=1 Tax=Auritidibacter ignavus TaxID=678932 RepID=UPI00109C34DA|nr:ABC transporter permease [Auritidibacter ignavus]